MTQSNDPVREALAMRIRVLVEGLADQQAYGDDWWRAELDWIVAALSQPPQAQPLSEEEVWDVANQFALHDWSNDYPNCIKGVVRHVEKHHGITKGGNE